MGTRADRLDTASISLRGLHAHQSCGHPARCRFTAMSGHFTVEESIRAAGKGTEERAITT